MKKLLCGVCLLWPTMSYGATVQLSWQDNSSNETSFNIQRRAADQAGAWNQIGSVGANEVTYNDTVPAGMGACYQVTATGAGGTSAPSNEACVTIPIAPVPPIAPTGASVIIQGTMYFVPPPAPTEQPVR